MADFTREGYGQVEINQMSFQKTGQIYASLPLDPEVTKLQQGEFMYYDYANGTVNCGKTNSGASGDTTIDTVGEPMLVYNEIKLYQPQYRETYKDFVIVRVGDNYVTTDKPVTGTYGDGSQTTSATINLVDYPYRLEGFAPRVVKTNIGDLYTTNMVKIGTGIEYNQGDILVPVANSTTHTMQLEAITSSYTGTMKWMVVKVYTMPDGQPGLKLQRVA